MFSVTLKIICIRSIIRYAGEFDDGVDVIIITVGVMMYE